MTNAKLTESIKAEAASLGFSFCGVCPAVKTPGFDHLRDWLDAGYAGEMKYIADRFDAYEHPESVLTGAKSVVVLGMNYQTSEPSRSQAGQGRVARYAWGESDYHDIIHDRLKQLCGSVRGEHTDINVRGVVDTAPLLEREFAQLAGIGWKAKNTLIINRELGSWFFLAAMLLDIELEYDQPHESSHCGTCTACLDACPTDAFVGPNILDATKCISYLTIEHRSPIPHELRPLMDDWLFGCDVCQDVCPWNRKAPRTEQAGFQPREDQNPVNLAELFSMSDDQFRERYRRTPLWRSKRRGILRNAAIVLGNHPAADSTDALLLGMNDSEPLVRGASVWAIGRILLNSEHAQDHSKIKSALDERAKTEVEESVVAEIEAVLKELSE